MNKKAGFELSKMLENAALRSTHSIQERDKRGSVGPLFQSARSETKGNSKTLPII